MRARSAKRAAVAPRRAALVRRVLDERPWCEAGEKLTEALDKHRCNLTSSDVHEPLTRGRGGDILDTANTLAVCRLCHDALHLNPEIATRLGFLRTTELA